MALEQLVMNLVLNACDAMGAGGILRVSTAAHGAGDGRRVRLTVADTGIGIAPEVMPRVFTPGFTTKGARGTGVGLAAVRAIAERAGGEVGVQSRMGEGTTFTVELPIATGALAGPADGGGPDGDGASAPVPGRLAAGAAPTVLLVEDEPALRRLTATVLAEGGYTVLQAADGEQALAVSAAFAGAIDALVTDVEIGRPSGPELVAQLAVTRPGLRVLFVSGYHDSRLVAHGVRPAAVNLLVKPFGADELLARVQALAGSPGSTSGEGDPGYT
jgi:two-component system, cell cycle sensor histidine kinase and response regulator CckA